MTNLNMLRVLTIVSGLISVTLGYLTVLAIDIAPVLAIVWLMQAGVTLYFATEWLAESTEQRIIRDIYNHKV